MLVYYYFKNMFDFTSLNSLLVIPKRQAGEIRFRCDRAYELQKALFVGKGYWKTLSQYVLQRTSPFISESTNCLPIYNMYRTMIWTTSDKLDNNSDISLRCLPR